MLFSDENLFESAKATLADSLSALTPEKPNPLPCDRWLARSALQKAVRRGDQAVAVRSVATLLLEDPRSVWRHLTVICLEDIGVANVGLLTQIVAARQDRRWRGTMGGDWRVIAGLVRLMAASDHCQANCDLLLQIENDPRLEERKAHIRELNPNSLCTLISQSSSNFVDRGMAALAFAGCLSKEDRFRDPFGLFEMMVAPGCLGDLVEACRTSWKISRNPMAVLMPIVWRSYTAEDTEVCDDRLPPTKTVHGVPEYAFDQFTRAGNVAVRSYLKDDKELLNLLEKTRLSPSGYVRLIGDVIFLLEGGVALRRLKWPVAETMRRPARWLPAVGKLGKHLPKILSHCHAQASRITLARARAYIP